MKKNADKVKVLHTFSMIDGVGSRTLLRLMEAFSDGEKMLRASEEEIIAAGISPKIARVILGARGATHTEEEWEKLRKQNISVIPFGDDMYPPLLAEIPDPPALLFVRGNIAALHKPAVAVVGTRKPTHYGKSVADRLSGDLARAGIVIISGLAFGLDSAAHTATLAAGGTTVAVLGSGLAEKHISPRSHIPLARAITEKGGALVSEYPPDTPASVGTFPARNRIIAGLAAGTVVVEAAQKSGTLITARLAIEYNREVFAVPGSVYSPSSEGAHMLLRQGARIASCAQDILDTLRLSNEIQSSGKDAPKMDTSALSDEEKRILRALSDEPLAADTISARTEISSAKIAAYLTILQMNGFIEEIGVGVYRVNFKV